MLTASYFQVWTFIRMGTCALTGTSKSSGREDPRQISGTTEVRWMLAMEGHNYSYRTKAA